MSVMLISTETASRYFRRDTSVDDPELVFLIKAASAAVMVYLQDGTDAFTDTYGAVTVDSGGIVIDVPEDIQLATGLLVNDFSVNRSPTPNDPVPAEYGYGYLPRAVVALLYPYRSPTL